MSQPLNFVLFRKVWSARKDGGDQAFHHLEAFKFAAGFGVGNRKFFDPTRAAREDVAKPVADMWASIYAHIMTTGAGNHAVVRDALYCCEAILANKGYSPCVQIRDVLPPSGARAAMLVPGCQTQKLLRNRAVVGAEVYHRMLNAGIPTVTVLSGARPPGQQRVSIRNESLALKRHFVEHFAWRQNKHVQDLDIENALIARDVTADQRSTSTKANVRNFMASLRKEFGGRRKTDGPALIVAVSSTFHLIRLAEDLEAALGRIRLGGSLLRENCELLLVGAENLEAMESEPTSGIVRHPQYLKSLFFEPFRYLAEKGLLPAIGTGKHAARKSGKRR